MRKHFFKICGNNETFVSELLENIEDMFRRYYTYSSYISSSSNNRPQNNMSTATKVFFCMKYPFTGRAMKCDPRISRILLPNSLLFKHSLQEINEHNKLLS